MFDSPLFWILVVWWILSTFLGGKKRIAKLAPQASDDDGLDLESSFTTQAAPVQTDAASEPKRPLSKLEQLLQRMGVPEEFKSVEGELKGLGRQLGLIEEEVEFVPPAVMETPAVETDPEPVIEPEQDYRATVRKHSKPKWVPQKVERVDLMGRIAHLPPLQQAIILKEVLDRPRAARYGRR